MNRQLWICPTCKGTLITFVALSEPPTCTNSNKHSIVDMERKKGRANETNRTREGAG
jgi:hypothetical protein